MDSNNVDTIIELSMINNEFNNPTNKVLDHPSMAFLAMNLAYRIYIPVDAKIMNRHANIFN